MICLRSFIAMLLNSFGESVKPGRGDYFNPYKDFLRRHTLPFFHSESKSGDNSMHTSSSRLPFRKAFLTSSCWREANPN